MVFGPFGFGDLPISVDYIKYEVIGGERPWQDLAKAHAKKQEQFHVADTAEAVGVTPEEFLEEVNKHLYCFERYTMDEEGWSIKEYDGKVEERWSIDVFTDGDIPKFLAWYNEHVKKTGWKGGSRVGV